MACARTFVISALAALCLSAAPPAAEARTPLPPGFRSKAVNLAPGVIQETMVRRVVPLVVHVARVQPGAPFELRAVISHGTLNGSKRGLQRTSQMCATARCIAAVNGDFFGAIGQPVGGVVSDGEMVRSPSRTHHQFGVLPEGGFSATQMTWVGALSAEGAKDVRIHGVNVGRDLNQAVLYTPRNGISTRTNSWGAEMVLRVVDPSGPLQLGQATVMRLESFRTGGNTRIPADGAVLSAHGSSMSALQELWKNAAGGTGTLRIATDGDDVRETVGGTPILMRNGRRWFANNESLFRIRAPRTIVGWNKKGELLLVTIDGRQPGYSVGATLIEATQLMARLGATEAINLDGGGSTTFISRGRVINRPSDRVVKRGKRRVVVHVPRKGDHVMGYAERRVADALVLVPVESTMTASFTEDPRRDVRAPLVPATTGVFAWMVTATSWAFYIRRRTKMVFARR